MDNVDLDINNYDLEDLLQELLANPDVVGADSAPTSGGTSYSVNYSGDNRGDPGQ